MAWYDYLNSVYFVHKWIYHRLLDEASPLSVGLVNIAVPLASEGSPIPLVYGKCRVRAPVLIFSGNTGNLGADPHYEIDMLFAVGIPFDNAGMGLTQIWAGEIALNPSVIAAVILVPVNANLGGPGHGGGIYGFGNLYTGFFNTHGAGDTIFNRMIIAGVDPTLIPNYTFLGMVSLISWSIGESPNITGYSFEVTSIINSSAPAWMGNLFDPESDPAGVAYDLLAGTFGKIGLATSKINKTSFQTASNILFAEGHGYSRAIEQPADASDLINDVLKQIDGLFYEEPTTGQINLKLIRNDYNLATVLDVNPDNASTPGPSWISIQGWNETINQVKIIFTDRANNYVDGNAQAVNASNSVAQGRLRGIELRFPGITTRGLAISVAGRELAARSRPSVKCTVIVNRTFYATRPGDVVTLSWPELGIDHMIMRVASMDFGQLHANAIVMNLIRDVFGETRGG